MGAGSSPGELGLCPLGRLGESPELHPATEGTMERADAGTVRPHRLPRGHCQHQLLVILEALGQTQGPPCQTLEPKLKV